MKGAVTCKHCKGTGDKFLFKIIPVRCPYCNGTGHIWVDNIDDYYSRQETDK